MLAIDTNLVVRYLLADDPDQATKARRLIDSNDVFVCTTVLLETEWVLRRLYKFSTDECANLLAAFAGLPRVILEDSVTVAKALGWLRQGLDFADALHLAKSEGCEAFISFDQALARSANALDGIRVRTP
jgi:predicted nucleic-acid-binding protein